MLLLALMNYPLWTAGLAFSIHRRAPNGEERLSKPPHGCLPAEKKACGCTLLRFIFSLAM
jgi:hypothetical protein